MNTQPNEQLSAFIDGEIPAKNQADLSARLLQDPALRQTMARYRQIGDTLRRQADTPIDASDIVARIQDDLAQEPHLLAPNNLKRSRPMPRASRIAWGAGLAAVVAIVAIGVAPPLLNPHNPLTARQTVASAPTPTTNSPENAQAVSVASVKALPQRNQQATSIQIRQRLSDEQLQQLTPYLVEHNEYANLIRVGRPSAHVNSVAVKNANP